MRCKRMITSLMAMMLCVGMYSTTAFAFSDENVEKEVIPVETETE